MRRQRPHIRYQDQQLVDALASASNFKEAHKKLYIGNILFNDSIDQQGSGGMWSFGSDQVSGGRMGRDHTLDDVPNHFVRDFLLSYINNIRQYSEEQKEAGRKALFPDLTTEDVKDYSALLARKAEDEDEEERKSMGIPGRNATPEEIRKYRLKMIMFADEVKNMKQAEAVLHQQDVVRAIDETVDLEPLQEPLAIRQYEKLKPISCSVLKPGALKSLDERTMSRPTRIDRNCDQIRLMIRRFCYPEREDADSRYYFSDNGFTIDQFQKALGVQRLQMTDFLGKKGPNEGASTKAYHLAWEFFKKRELLGCPLRTGEESEESEEEDIVEERDSNAKGNKRRIDDADTTERNSKRRG